jgi:hypothetical protein
MMRRKELHPLSLNRVFKVTPAGPRNTKSMRQCPQRSCPIRFLALFVVSAVGAKTALAGRCPQWLSGCTYPSPTQPVSSPGSTSGVLSAQRLRSAGSCRGGKPICEAAARCLRAPTRRRRRAPGRSSLVERERYQGSHRALRRNSRPHTSPHGSTPSEGKAGEILSLCPGGPSARRSLRRPHDADDAPHEACVICVITG